MDKKLFLILGLLLSVSLNVLAVEVGSQVINVGVSETFVSRYIWRGQDLYGDNDGGLFHNLDFSSEALGGVLGLNLWGANSVTGGHEDGEEYDYTLSYSKDLADGAYNLTTGYTYFDFPNGGSTADVGEPWASFTVSAPENIGGLPFSLSLFAGYDFATKSGGPDEGWYYSWGIDTELSLSGCPLATQDQTLSVGIVNWGQDGVADLKPNSLYATEINLSTGFSVGEYTLTPSIHYLIGHDEAINNGDEEVWFGFEVSRGF